MYNMSRKPRSGWVTVPEHQQRSSLAREVGGGGGMLLTVTRSACSTGPAPTFLTISNINEVVLAVNSQHVACKLKGNCATATPPNLPLSRSADTGGCRMKDGADLLESHVSYEAFYTFQQIIPITSFVKLKAEYTRISCRIVFAPDKCDRGWFTCNICMHLETHPNVLSVQL